MPPRGADSRMHALADRTLFFLHLPKTAGTSLRELLSCRFGGADILAFERTDSPELRRQKLASVERFRFVHGHMPYALVEWWKRRPFVMTVLRDPVERAVSSFHYMQRQATAVMQMVGGAAAARARDFEAASRMSLGEFIRREPRAAARHLGNLQSWFLATPNVNERFEYGDDHTVSVSNLDLERAKEHLAACDAVGLTERMSESTELLAYSLHTRPFGEVSSANRSHRRPAVADLDDATTAALIDLTARDRELYAFASALVEERRRAMMRRLLVLDADRSPTPGRAFPAPPPVFTFDSPIPGDGWYAPERAGDRWFSWTGPTCESSIEVASPPGTEFVLKLGVLHAMRSEFLSTLDLRVNGVRLHVWTESDAAGHVLTASVPRALIGPPGEGNWIGIRVPRVIRPCEEDPGTYDSRLLGIAVHRIELAAIEGK
ncbi:MAG: hypothetical protein GEU82_10945 [Luteitalea sp.]|nr:hypothetical protein [Luteitalea sp.]